MSVDHIHSKACTHFSRLKLYKADSPIFCVRMECQNLTTITNSDRLRKNSVVHKNTHTYRSHFRKLAPKWPKRPISFPQDPQLLFPIRRKRLVMPFLNLFFSLAKSPIFVLYGRHRLHIVGWKIEVVHNNRRKRPTYTLSTVGTYTVSIAQYCVRVHWCTLVHYFSSKVYYSQLKTFQAVVWLYHSS